MKPKPCPFCGQLPWALTASDLVRHECNAIGITFQTKCSTWNIRQKPVKAPKHNAAQSEMNFPAVRSPAQERNDLLLCALYSAELGTPVQKVTGSDAVRVAMALKIIKAYTPDVTPEEVQRRADIYRMRWPNVDLTANALAKWWNKMPTTPVLPGRPTSPEGRKLQTQVNREQEIHNLKRQYGLSD